MGRAASGRDRFALRPAAPRSPRAAAANADSPLRRCTEAAGVAFLVGWTAKGWMVCLPERARRSQFRLAQDSATV